jgi:hypothetical protein
MCVSWSGGGRSKRAVLNSGKYQYWRMGTEEVICSGEWEGTIGEVRRELEGRVDKELMRRTLPSGGRAIIKRAGLSTSSICKWFLLLWTRAFWGGEGRNSRRGWLHYTDAELEGHEEMEKATVVCPYHTHGRGGSCAHLAPSLEGQWFCRSREVSGAL